MKRRQEVSWETLNRSGENFQEDSPASNTLETRPGEDTGRHLARVRTAEKFSLAVGMSPKNTNNEETGGGERVCRICLCEEDEQDDPIVPPCQCQGTMREVHVKCFKKWLTKHVTTKDTPNMHSIVWDKLKCELCGTEVESTAFILLKSLDLLFVMRRFSGS